MIPSSRALAGHPKAIVLRWLPIDRLEGDCLSDLARLLDRSEVERVGRFHFERDRRAYVAAHALVRVLLSERAGTSPTSWRFVAGHKGKPEVDPSLDAPRPRFNLSHTGSLVAVAVTSDHEVGVDVERVDPRRLGPEVTDRFFAPAEVEHLRSLDGAERTEAAYAYWTLKEAYIKAIGLGMSCPLDAFHFDLDPLRIHFSARLQDDPARWLIRRLRLTTHHALALMVRHDRPADLRVDAREMRIDELRMGGQAGPGSGAI